VPLALDMLRAELTIMEFRPLVSLITKVPGGLSWTVPS
jgi:hypothetical protein